MTPRELEQSMRSRLQRPMADAELRAQLEQLAADDISFSGFTWLFGPELYVTGVVVNKDLGLSRQERRRLRAAQHQLSRLPAGEPDERRQWLAGKLAYLSMLNPQQAEHISNE